MTTPLGEDLEHQDAGPINPDAALMRGIAWLFEPRVPEPAPERVDPPLRLPDGLGWYSRSVDEDLVLTIIYATKLEVDGIDYDRVNNSVCDPGLFSIKSEDVLPFMEGFGTPDYGLMEVTAEGAWVSGKWGIEYDPEFAAAARHP